MFLCFIYYSLFILTIYFFSSRRLHTRSKRDWSSDVCSSDLSSSPSHRTTAVARTSATRRTSPAGWTTRACWPCWEIRERCPMDYHDRQQRPRGYNDRSEERRVGKVCRGSRCIYVV